MSLNPKRPKGPPLNAMRAFDSAARHESFAVAAEELNVTPGAISQHIKTLESWASVPLFRRNAQGVRLTDAGKRLAGEFTLAFDALSDATRSLLNLKPNADFHIAALPSVALLWLPRRLSKVRMRFPQINFSVTALENPPSFSRDLFDLSIFFGKADETLNQICLCPDEIIPVCAPMLNKPGKGFQDLTLLHDQTWLDDWAIWSQAVNEPLQAHQNGPQYSLYSLAVEETKAGAGILMGHLCLIDEALTAGLLVRAHERSCTTGRHLLINLPPPSRQRPETQEVVNLLSA